MRSPRLRKRQPKLLTQRKAAAGKLADTVSSAAASGLAAIAYTGIGHPYVWGGTTPNGWDCSGFTQWVYAQAGISIPRANAWTAMRPTSTPSPGDLVMQNGGAHVGIYVGNGMMISALNPVTGHPAARRCSNGHVLLLHPGANSSLAASGCPTVSSLETLR